MTKTVKAPRASNIELLRILAMMGVIVLHYNNSGIGGGFSYVSQGSVNFYLLHLLECIAICAVDLFVLITGYFSCTSERCTVWKPIRLVTQVILYQEAIFVMQAALKLVGSEAGFTAAWLLKGILRNLLPVNYFVMLYVALYLISPYINRLICGMDRGQMKKMVAVLFGVFSVWPTVVDVLGAVLGEELGGMSSISAEGSQAGYTIVNFALMYFIGAYLRKHVETRTPGKWGLAAAAVWLALFGLTVADQHLGGTMDKWFLFYSNPLVILSAVFTFLLFRDMKMKPSKLVNKLASASFSVFLLHTVLITRIGIEAAVRSDPVWMLCHMVVGCVLIYGACFAADWIYGKTAGSCLSALERKLSKKESVR